MQHGTLVTICGVIVQDNETLVSPRGSDCVRFPFASGGHTIILRAPNVNVYIQRVKIIVMKSFKLFKPLACLWLVLASCMVTAEGGGLVTTNDDFLPVAEAYQPSLMIQDDTLVIDWTIADGYYLYKDKFRLSAKAEDGTALPMAPEYETGKVKYDEYFQKEVETFYHTTQIRIPIAGFPNVFELKLRSQGCADAGLAPGIDVKTTSCTWWAAIHGLTSLLIAHNRFPWADREQMIDNMLRTLVAGLLGSRARAPGADNGVATPSAQTSRC